MPALAHRILGQNPCGESCPFSIVRETLAESQVLNPAGELGLLVDQEQGRAFFSEGSSGHLPFVMRSNRPSSGRSGYVLHKTFFRATETSTISPFREEDRARDR